MTAKMDALLLKVVRKVKGFKPQLSKSKKWVTWVTNIIPTTCKYCAEQHARIFDTKDSLKVKPPVHPNCNCYFKVLLAILAGTATPEGKKGLDFYMKYHKSLPTDYMTKEAAEAKGWNSRKGNLRDVLPTTTIGGNRYYNDNLKLPCAKNRIWYEADIIYYGGYRDDYRLLYSNDGLLFVTYDHYITFYEIK